MRFLMLMYPGPQVERGDAAPDGKLMAAMMKYNEELTRAGVLLSLDGLHPSAKGARITYPGGKPNVTNGPFSGGGGIVGGFWMLQVKSRAEAVEWAKRIPVTGSEMVEVRQVFELEEYAVDPNSALAAAVQRVEGALPRQRNR